MKRIFKVAVGSADVLKNCVKKRTHIALTNIGIKRGIAVLCRSVNNGEFNLILICAKLDKEVEHLVDNLVGSCAGAVDFVNDNKNLFLEVESLFQNESCLRHTALECVNEKKNAVNHGENSLNLAAEIGMAGGVNNVYFCVLVMNCRIL